MAARPALAAAHGAIARDAVARPDNPEVKGPPVDHCADIDAENNCSAAGEAKAASKACVAVGLHDQTAWRWRSASRPAMHYVREQDIHAGDVGGRRVAQPTTGPLDPIDCRK